MNPTPLPFGAALQNELRTQHSDFLFEPPWALRHVLRARFPEKSFGLHLHHERSLIVQREEVLTLFTPDELNTPQSALDNLPDALTLIAWPDEDAWEPARREASLLALWQGLFHARIDAHFHAHPLTRRRIRLCIHTLEQQGAGLFDTIRDVVLQERLIEPTSHDELVFYEFVALCAELSHFHPVACTHTFPSLPSWRQLRSLLRLDLDTDAILDTTRPPHAPQNPTAHSTLLSSSQTHTLTPSDPRAAEGVTRAVLQQANDARTQGNDVRALISAVRAYRAALPKLQDETQHAVNSALHSLCTRTIASVYRDMPPPDGSINALIRACQPLLPSINQGIFAPHTRLLYDLQKACIAFERPPLRSNVLRRLRHGSQEPWSTPLPFQGRIAALKSIERALERTVSIHLTIEAKRALRTQLKTLVQHITTTLRATLFEHLRPILDDIGLHPSSTPETIAADKLIHELIDQLFDRGFLHIGALRDTLSRNHLKLEDLSQNPLSLLTGDPLLRFDRALHAKLPGLYRRGELYMRALQKFSSLSFGTWTGRMLVLWAALPLGGAYVILYALQFSVLPLIAKVAQPPEPLPSLLTPPVIATLSLTLLALIHSTHIRAFSITCLRAVWTALKAIFFHAPQWFARLSWVQAFWGSLPIRIIRRVVLKPLIPTAIVGGIVAAFGTRPWIIAAVAVPLFLTLSVWINTRAGQRLEERLTESLGATVRSLRDHLIPGLIRWTLDLFQSMTQRAERLLYRIDERLRFRQGTSRPVAVLKFLARGVWSIFAYIARFCINLLIEPQVNPIKHFPVVTVSHKIMISFSPLLAQLLSQFLGTAMAASVTGAIVFLTPGIFGFLVWEFKENWKLYKANAPNTLTPVVIGHHGETMRGLLQPGFHSGTVPKATQRLRNAERNTATLGLWKPAHAYQHELQHVEHAIERLVHRELLHLLEHTRAPSLSLRHVQAISSHIRILLDVDDPDPKTLGKGPHTLSLTFRSHGTRILCNVRHQDWLDRLEPDALRDIQDALCGFCAMCDTDIFLAHIRQILPDGHIPQFTRGYLNIWSNDLTRASRYRLAVKPGEPLLPNALPGTIEPLDDLPTLQLEDVFASHTPIHTTAWAERWSATHADQPLHPHTPL